MKIGNKFGMTFLAVSALFAFASCSQLQDSLSSEQNADVEEKTGKASISGDTWYYNGSSSSNMTSDSTAVLTVSLSQKAALSANGVLASYEISYTDANGNTSTVTKKLEGEKAGYLSTDGKTFNLFMSPVLAILDGDSDSAGTSTDGTAKVKVSLSGLISASGSQAGRSLSSLEKTVKVKPLFSDTTLTSIAYSTLSSTLNRAIEIPALSDVSLASGAFLTLDGIEGCVSASDFTLSASGSTIYITPKIELGGVVADVSVGIDGICTDLANSYKQNFKISLGGMVSSSDSWNISKTDTLNYAMESVVVATGENALTVTVNSADKLGGWKGNRIGILIDDLNVTTGNAISSVIDNNKVATTVTSNDSVEFYGAETMANWDNSSLNNNNWTEDSSNYVYYANSTSLIYTIPYSSIDSSANSSDTFRIVVVFADNWDSGTFHVQNVIPAAAATVTTTSEENDTLALDFSKALIIGAAADIETPAPSAPKYFSATSVSSDSVTLSWSEVYGATSYKVMRAGTEVYSGTDTTCSDSSLEAGTNYTYEVYAVNSTGESNAKTLTVITTVAKPGSFTLTVTPATFSTSGTDVTLSWTESAFADSYKVEYKKATDSGYTTGVTSTTDKSATLSSLAMGSYSIRVTAVNDKGETQVTETAALYPMIALDGTLEAAYTAESTGASTTDTLDFTGDSAGSNQNDSGHNLETVYVTNDSTYLYVAVKFAGTPSLYEKERVTIFLDNASSSTGGAVSTCKWVSNDIAEVGLGTTVTLADGSSVEAEVTSVYDGSSAVKTCITNNASDYSMTDIETNVSTTTFPSIWEYKIPLSKVASLSVSNTVYIFAAVSHREWSSSATAGIADCAKKSACTMKATDGNYYTVWAAWAGDTDYKIDMTQSLSYTIK